VVDFADGVANANEYLNRTVSVPTSVTVNDQGTVTATTTDLTVREIICSLLAGNGIKLPNLQICLKINLGRLIPEIPAALAALKTALTEAEAELEKFIAHTDIENVLNRMNSAIAEVAAVANMINFCGTPIVPRAIPNVLADAFGSFTGAGHDLLDSLGQLATSEIGGCIGTDGKFKADLFTGGLLKDIGDNLANIASLPASITDQWTATANKFKTDMAALVELENKFGTGSTESKGGSNFAPNNRVNTNVGVAIDVENMSIQQAQRLGAGLKGSYDQLKGYEVDGQGNNIFHYILEPEMIAKLEATIAPVNDVSDRIPTYDYCGKVIGYTDVPKQTTTAKSTGEAAVLPTQPGLDGISTAGQVVHSDSSTTTNLGAPVSSGGGGGSASGYATDSDVASAIAGITVVQNAVGTASLTYSGTSPGVLTYTPPDLTGIPLSSSLASVAFNGDYNSLINRPSSFADQTLNQADSVVFDTVTVTNFNTTGTGTSNFSAVDITMNASNRTSVLGGPFRLPNLTTTQRNAIGSPVGGDMVYNSSTNKVNVYQGTGWINLDDGSSA